MVSAQDIRDVRFNRSIGGYKTDEVDAFLEVCADTVEQLTKTNEENSRKMQVLAESVVEYRKQEDSIRNALLHAQRASDEMMTETRQKADEVLAAANAEAEQTRAALQAEKAEQRERIQKEADEKVASVKKEVEDAKSELARLQQEVAAFKSKLLGIYHEHLTLIGVLGDEQPADEILPDAKSAE